MSKVQEKDANLLSNLSGSEIASELDSRLRDLEKNIAVAREFIKLADESYSELRHKWNLLNEEVRNKSLTRPTERAVIAEEKMEARPTTKMRSKTKAQEAPKLDEPKSPGSADFARKPETHAKRVKTENRSKKGSEIPSENTDSITAGNPSQPYRDPGRRRGKASGRN